MGLTVEQREHWDRDGFVILRQFVEADRLPALLARADEIARAADTGADVAPALVMPEKALAAAELPEMRLSKIFRLARQEPLFHAIATDPQLLALVADLLGPDVDNFLSQFIYKRPGALGQPWHQDAWYFRMQPSMQIGAWLAVTAATPENGPLSVIPGSHLEPVHEDTEWDSREHAGSFYVEIQNEDTSTEITVLMEPGDLLVFHSHLRHRSSDNGSETSRAAMVYHYATPETERVEAHNHDWMPVWRAGAPVGSD